MGMRLVEIRARRYRALRLFHEDVEELFQAFAGSGPGFAFRLDGRPILKAADIGAGPETAEVLEADAPDMEARLRLDGESAEFHCPDTPEAEDLRGTVDVVLTGGAMPLDFISTLGFPLSLIVLFVALFQANAMYSFMSQAGQYVLIGLGLAVWVVGYRYNFQRYCVINLRKHADAKLKARKRRYAFTVTVILILAAILLTLVVEHQSGRLPLP